MTLGALIAEYRTQHDLSQRQFAALCGLSNGYISMLEKNENPKTGLPVTPSLLALKKISQSMGISMDELFSKVDDMPVDLFGEFVKSPESVPSNVFPLPESRSYPLIGSIACGEPILAAENISEYIQFPGDIDADFCLRCKGDSMINARIYDGDIVFIRKQDHVETGEIAAVRIGDEATLKRVYYVPGSDRITLRACNPLFPDMEFEGDALNDMQIIGKAVSFLSSVR